VLAGGEGRPAGLEAGYFVKPTVFVNVTNNMTIAQEEIFGPVLSVIAYDSEDEAIRIANDSKYAFTPLSSGLTSSAHVAWLLSCGLGAS
jgi:aldehyde dehydrogenase (NAD+)